MMAKTFKYAAVIPCVLATFTAPVWAFFLLCIHVHKWCVQVDHECFFIIVNLNWNLSCQHFDWLLQCPVLLKGRASTRNVGKISPTKLTTSVIIDFHELSKQLRTQVLDLYIICVWYKRVLTHNCAYQLYNIVTTVELLCLTKGKSLQTEACMFLKAKRNPLLPVWGTGGLKFAATVEPRADTPRSGHTPYSGQTSSHGLKPPRSNHLDGGHYRRSQHVSATYF